MLQTTRPRKPLTLQMTVMFTPTPVTAFDENANYQNRLNEVVNALQDIMQKRLRRDATGSVGIPQARLQHYTQNQANGPSAYICNAQNQRIINVGYYHYENKYTASFTVGWSSTTQSYNYNYNDTDWHDFKAVYRHSAGELDCYFDEELVHTFTGVTIAKTELVLRFVVNTVGQLDEVQVFDKAV